MIALAIVYVALAGLVCALVARNRAPFLGVALVCAVAPIFAFAVWQAAQPPTGWPASASPPRDAAFVWANIREPDQLADDRGEIDLWLVPAGAAQPRAYRLPYSRQLHQAAQRAMDATRGGMRLGVRSRRERKRIRFVFYQQPPIALPHK